MDEPADQQGRNDWAWDERDSATGDKRRRHCARRRDIRAAADAAGQDRAAGKFDQTRPSAQEQLYTLMVHTTFVQVPVTVKDQGRAEGGWLLSTDFTVKENGAVQKLSFFTADPFALSVAIVLDLGMPDADGAKSEPDLSGAGRSIRSL